MIPAIQSNIPKNKIFSSFSQPTIGSTMLEGKAMGADPGDIANGIAPRKIQNMMRSINDALVGGNGDSLKKAVARSGGHKETLQTIEPTPQVRMTSARAFAEET